MSSKIKPYRGGKMSRANELKCIITYFDLIGIKKRTYGGEASSLMRKMHRRVIQKINDGLPSHNYGYVWNDSVILVSNASTPVKYRETLLRELCDFKAVFEGESGLKSFAISVMGQRFSEYEPFSKEGETLGKAILLKASSWAMANCFEIEKALKRKRAQWYLDSRITKGLKFGKPCASEDVKLLPNNRPRKIYMYMKLSFEAPMGI